MCVNIHQSVAAMSLQFLAELSRHNYVTPTSYLELLGTFSRLLKLKKSEISNARQRTKTGLDKVCVNVLQCMYNLNLCMASSVHGVSICIVDIIVAIHWRGS